VLKDSKGEKIGLSDFRGKKNLVLFFCQGKRNKVCLDWLEELSRFYNKFQMRKIEILSFSPDERWVSHRIKEERKIPFPILKMEGEDKLDSRIPSVSERYGIEAEESGKKVLCPAIFMVDKGGTVRFRKVLTPSTDRLPLLELLCELEKSG
jgi:peroxiredoxin